MIFLVVMYGCESWTIKKAEHRRIDAFKLWCWRRFLRATPWTARKSNQSIPKGNPSWLLTGRTDGEAEVLTLWPPDSKNWLIGKDPDAGRDWREEEKGTTEDEMVGWHHQLNEHEFEQTPGDGKGQGGLACCSPWGCNQITKTMEGCVSSKFRKIALGSLTLIWLPRASSGVAKPFPFCCFTFQALHVPHLCSRGPNPHAIL